MQNFGGKAFLLAEQAQQQVLGADVLVVQVIIWDYDTAREFKTVNGVPGNGGAMDVGGPIVAGGMLFVSSGYARRSLAPGNVLVAFGVER